MESQKRLLLNLLANLKRNTRLLTSVFLLILCWILFQQIYIVNNLPQLLNNLVIENQKYTQTKQDILIKQIFLNKKLETVARDKDGIESSARYQLGFIKKNEKYYDFP